MKFKTKRLLTVMSAAIISAVSVVATTSSADRALRDANGDGATLLNDAILTNSYLLGKYNPTNVKSFDFDGNGVISEMDKAKIQHYLLGNIDDTGLPGPSTETVSTYSRTLYYRRHDCSDTNPSSRTAYSLTVDYLDNSASSNNPVPYEVFPPNNMVLDNDTAVVRLERENGGGNGTGFIVGDHIIATAAHCVYNNGFYNMNIEIIDSNNQVVETLESRYIHIPELYAYNSPNSHFDYALIYVEEDLSEYGAFKMGIALDDYIENNGSVVVSGFGNEYPDNYSGPTGEIRLKSVGNVAVSNDHELQNSKLFYDADASGGSSGGPVYVEEAFYAGGTWYTYKNVVAIHTNGSSQYENYNCGTRVNPSILKFYYNNAYLTE